MGPIIAGLIVLAVGDRNPREARWDLACRRAIVGFLVTILASSPVSDGHERHAVRGAESLDSPFQRQLPFGVDGISVLFILPEQLHHRAGCARPAGR